MILRRIVQSVKAVLLIISILTGSVFGILHYCSDQRKAQVSLLHEKTGGYVYGVCHPNEHYEQIQNAGLNWVRFDVPFPYNQDGTLSQSYLSFKERARGYTERGIKVMAITPYPRSYIEYGLDPRKSENEQAIKDIAVFMLHDLRDVISAVQITNEMGVDHFTKPLTLEEAAQFIGIQLEAVYPVRGNLPVGYNSSGSGKDLHKLMKQYLNFCDYVGVDIYMGCFGGPENELKEYKSKLKSVYRLVKKPILMQEFGYMSAGEAKTEEEKRAVLQSYGVNSEEEARADIVSFASRLPWGMQNYLNTVCTDTSQWGDTIFGALNTHLYRELPKGTNIKGYPHTPEGQADFYRDTIAMFADIDFLAGFFIYCYQDSPSCYICSQSDCPIETRWGLTDMNGKEKLSYYAVRDAIAAAKA